MLIFDQLKRNDLHLRVVTWGVLVGLLILLAGLGWVQVISYRHYSENQKAQSFRTVRIPPIRGRILDRNGVPLGENQPTYNLGLYLNELRQQFTFAYTNRILPQWRATHPRDKLSRAQVDELKRLARYLAASNIVQALAQSMQQPIGLEWDRFHRHYYHQLALPLPVVQNMNPLQVARFHERVVNPPGVDVEMMPMRFYPGGPLAAHVLGYLAYDDSSIEGEEAFFNYRLADFRGKVGIEAIHDMDLHGRAGVKSVLVNSLGYRQSETTWTEATPGKNVVLTLDATVQKAAEEALAGALPTKPVRGAVVVMNPNNGDVLALASSPAYDPNAFLPRISHEEYARLIDPKLRPQINRATQENYAPGSIFKIVVSLAALEEGLYPKQKLYNPGFIYIGRRGIRDTAPAGEYDFQRAFIKSCNTYFISNGIEAGIESIIRMGQRLHLGERTGLLPGQETPGHFPSLTDVQRDWRDGDTANVCIGQGPISVTPLQMAVMVAAIANGGKVLWPRLVQRLQPQATDSEEPVMLFPTRPPRGDLGVKDRTLQLIRDAMLADVEDQEATGRAAAVAGLRICSKTGTAQVTDPQNRVIDHTTWFVSYAPYENPRYVVIVMVESGASGGGTCAPAAAKIYSALLKMEGARTTVASTP